MNQAVTELVVRGRTEGVTEARSEVEALERAHEKAQATTEKATLGMQRMAERVQSRLDPQFRATARLRREEEQLNLLREKGLITQERQNALLAMAAQRYSAAGAAAGASAAGVAQAGRAAQLSAFQMQNLSFQMNDIAMGLATGQSPFRVMAQQGSQIVQIFGSGTGVVAALKATGAAMTSFLLNPLTLTAIGFGLALEAGMRFFSSIGSGASDVERNLERHKDLIGQVKDQWKAAEDGVHDYAASSRAVLLAEATLNRDALEADLLAMSQPFAPRPRPGPGPAPDVTATLGIGEGTFLLFPQIGEAVRELQEGIRAGTPDIRAFRDEIAELFNAAEPGSRLRDITGDLLRDEALRKAAELQAQLEQARDVTDGLGGDTRAMNRALGESADRFAAVERRAEAYGEALETLRGIAAPQLTDREAAAEQLRAMVDAAQGLDDITVALDEYARALERVAAAERDAERDALGDVQFRLSTMGLSERDRALAELRRQQAEEIAKAREAGTDPALLQRRHSLELREFDAQREAEFNDMLAERQRALAEEAGALGLSEAALARYRTETELTAEAMRLFGQVSPEMEAQIAAIGDAAARAVEQQRAMQDQIAAMDGLRRDVRGFLGDLVSGLRQGESAADALRSALDRLISRLADMGLDMIVAGLFGQQGTAGGGMFGNLFSGLFPGLLSGGVGAANDNRPVPVVVKGAGSFGDILGGGGSDVLIGNAGSGGMRPGTPFASTIEQAAARFNLSPSLIAGMIRQESNFNPSAVSQAGAQGLMQLMPGTARELGVNNPFDPTQNIMGGAQYMRQQLDRFGSVETALAAYNAGPGRVAGVGGDLSRLPAETQAYVPAVLAHQKAFVDGAGGMADATTQAADTLSTNLPQAADRMTGAAADAAGGADQLASGLDQAGQTAQGAATNFSGSFPGALNQVIQSIASAGGGSPFGGFSGGNFFGSFLGGGGFGGAPGFIPGVVMSHHSGGMVGAVNDNALRLASPDMFRNAVRAHGGLRLAPDERPIIAQTGERVLNRAETADYERRGRETSTAPAPVIHLRGGDIIIQGNADESTLPLIRQEIAASEARQQKKLRQEFGQIQGRHSALKVG